MELEVGIYLNFYKINKYFLVIESNNYGSIILSI